MLALAVEELERLDAVACHVQPGRRVRGLLERLLREPHVGGVVLDEEDVDEPAVAHAGSVKRNTVPPSFLGSTQIRPRCVATILAHTASPMPGPLVPRGGALERLEDPLGLIGRDADAVVGDRHLDAVALDLTRRHLHARGLLRAELHGVGDEVLEQLAQLRGIAGHRRQPLRADGRVLVADLRVQPVEDLRERRGEVDPLTGLFADVPARERSRSARMSSCIRRVPSSMKPMNSSASWSSFPL